VTPLDLVRLTTLVDRTSGHPEVKIGLIDGPVRIQHPELLRDRLHEIPGNYGAACTEPNSTACLHGTFVAGILAEKRNSYAPAVCPDCTLIIRPIFSETTSGLDHMPTATPRELASAIINCVDAGARAINLSLALAQPSNRRGAGPESCPQTWGAHRRGGGQSRHARRVRDYAPSMSHPGCGVRPSRSIDERVQSRPKTSVIKKRTHVQLM
jgi:subtilisin family serine protease